MHNCSSIYGYLRGARTIKPLALTQFWHRRLCEAVIFVAGSIIALYFWTFFTGTTGAGLLIDSTAVIMSAVAFFAGIIAYLWAPQNTIVPAALGVYALLAATAAGLVVTSGGVDSPFIALWILVAIFAGIFGLLGIIPMFLAGSAYLFIDMTTGSPQQDVVIVTIIASWLPLVASYIIWHGRKKHEEGKDRAFRDLASELSEVASKAEVVINAIADGVIAVDAQGIIQLINPAAQQLTGWGKQDATTLSYKSVLQLTDRQDKELPEASDPIQHVLATNKETETHDLFLKTHSGKKLMVSVVVSPVGQLGAGAIVVFRDITKEKAEEREQAEFISTASHEMRTPVASIEGYLGLALNPNTAQIDEKARDFIIKAHESAQHLGRLFQDLLDVSRADDGRLSNNPKVIDVVQFTKDIVEGLRPQAEAKSLRFLFKPAPDNDQGDRHISPVFYAHVDNDHLREIISNITENAIKYTHNGDVIIDVTGDDEHIVVSVADSGIGIPAEDIPHLFQKFYRVDNSDTREIGGTGLGLYLCRKLAEMMGGRIWVESEYQKGSTFFIEVPRIDNQEATRLIEEAAAQDSEPNMVVAARPLLPNQEQALEPASPQITQQPQPPQAVHQQAPAAVIPPVPIVPAAPPAAPTIAQLEQRTELTAQSRPQTMQIPVRERGNNPEA